MSVLVVVERPENWSLDVPGVDLVLARDYLEGAGAVDRKGLRVFNLCRSYRYQSLGYYVSLLAEARGQRPLPSVTTIQDLRSPSLMRFISEDLDAKIQRSLASLVADEFSLSIYFGRNMAARHTRLALALFNLFPAPLLRARFARREGKWELRSLRPIASRDIPEPHRPFAVEAARSYFARGRPATGARPSYRYDLAILYDPKDELAPSDEKAIQRFVRAGGPLGLRCEIIGKDDYGRIAEFDALFLRQTTQVDHFTYRFARRAATDGLVVIDDPESILRCSNKVFLRELLTRHRVPIPRTEVVHRDNVEEALARLGLPAILKLPDGSFSRSVSRADDAESFRRQALAFLESSDLVIAQEYLPTDFDWRVGILDRQVLFVSRYKMVRGHWQIAQHGSGGKVRYGGVDTVPVENAPSVVVETALRATNLVGDGLYGVDLKERDGRVVVIEINDNPNMDSDVEDAVLGDELYRRVMETFLRRIERSKEAR